MIFFKIDFNFEQIQRAKRNFQKLFPTHLVQHIILTFLRIVETITSSINKALGRRNNHNQLENCCQLTKFKSYPLILFCHCSEHLLLVLFQQILSTPRKKVNNRANGRVLDFISIYSQLSSVASTEIFNFYKPNEQPEKHLYNSIGCIGVNVRNLIKKTCNVVSVLC